ncbi:MAG: PilX N-terminal domain-containing pilus assembly protein [Bacillota bacterium]
MISRLKNDRGIALLTVMIIMTVLVITGSLLLRMASSESRIIYGYGNNIRAFYVAEAGADLAIEQWNTYINNLTADPDVIDNTNNNQIVFAQTDVFYSQLNGSPRTGLIDTIRTGYGLGAGSSMADIQISDPGASALNMTVDTPQLLTLTITGTYDESTFEQRVQLWYYYDKTTGSYKGYGTEVVPGKPLPPPGGGGGGGGGTDNPLAVSYYWLHGGGPGQWEFTQATGTIKKTTEAIHDDAFYIFPINVPIDLNLYVSFELQGTDPNKWYDDYADFYLWDIFEQVRVRLKIIKLGNKPKVQVTTSSWFGSQTWTFDQELGSSSKYRIITAVENGKIKIDVSDTTGQKFSYTADTWMQRAFISLHDGTGSHVDPVFTFPPP